MKFIRDSVSAVTVRAVAPGSIRVGEDIIEGDVILTAETIIPVSLPPDISGIQETDIATALDTNPEMLILGTGWSPTLPPSGLLFSLARRGIGLETMDTPAACRTFNILVGEGRRPAAVLRIAESPDRNSRET